MKDYAVKKFLRVYGKSFPLKKKFNFTGFCKDVKSLIDEDYDYLLMNNDEYTWKKKKRDLLKRQLSIELKDIEYNKKNNFQNKRKILLKKQKLMLSSYNNKMMLDMMFNNKRYIKYITEKTKTRNNNSEKKEESINNNLTENNKTKDFFSSINTFETINDLITEKPKYLIQDNIMNKTYSQFAPKRLKSNVKQNNSFFPTAVPIKQPKNFPSIRNSLFNIHKINNSNKYNNKSSKYPNIMNNFINFNSNKKINESEENEKKKNSILTKINFNYNNNLRKKILFNRIQKKKESIEKNNQNNKNNIKINILSKKDNPNSPKINSKTIFETNLFRDEFNPIKKIYKTKINFNS